MRITLLAMFVAVPLSAGVRASAAEPTGSWPDSVQGYGLTIAGARQDGLREAVQRVKAYIRKMDPPLLEWEVTEEFVEKNLLDGPGFQGKEVPIGNEGTGAAWIYRLRPADHEMFVRLNRQALATRKRSERRAASESRLLLAFGMLGTVVVGLALAVAYLRWKERRRGSRG